MTKANSGGARGVIRRWWSKLTGSDECNNNTQQTLDQALRQRVQAMPATPLVAGVQSFGEQPLLVFDLETTGLNMQKDTVLSFGATRVEQMSIMLEPTLESVLRVYVDLQGESQLIHGLTQADLQEGLEPAAALLNLLEAGSDAIWVAYHAAFDQAMLQRAAKDWLGLNTAQVPVAYDLADILPVLFPGVLGARAGLDDWLGFFALDMPARHHAAADAFVTAQLTLIALKKAEQQGISTWMQLDAALRDWKKAEQAKKQREQAVF